VIYVLEVNILVAAITFGLAALFILAHDVGVSPRCLENVSRFRE
jgi:hypothetical protein